MIRVISQISIRSGATKTFNFIANPENNPKWQGGMKKCRITTDGALDVGSQYEQEAAFMGKEILTTFEITAYEPGHMIKGESIVSTFPITFQRIVEGDDQQCEVTAIVTGNPAGLMGLLPFLTRWIIKRSIDKDYRSLKLLMEKER